MRFAIKTRPEHTTWQQMRDVWVAADQFEIFESAWHWDHFYPLSGDMQGPNLEAWTTLAALAQATSRIRLGCQVTGMIYRHPAVLANMAATTDIISNGRLELGIGAGWNQMETAAYGIELYAAEGALRPLRRGHAGDDRAAHREGRELRRHVRQAHRGVLRTRSRCRRRTRRSPSAARARSARSARSPGGRSSGT